MMPLRAAWGRGVLPAFVVGVLLLCSPAHARQLMGEVIAIDVTQGSVELQGGIALSIDSESVLVDRDGASISLAEMAVRLAEHSQSRENPRTACYAFYELRGGSTGGALLARTMRFVEIERSGPRLPQ